MKPHRMLPSVYNLAFGPIDEDGVIDDLVQIAHKAYNKVFSSILPAGLSYLEAHPEHNLGVDGSTNNRAYLYYFIFKLKTQ